MTEQLAKMDDGKSQQKLAPEKFVCEMLIGMSGCSGAGKDTTADILCARFGFRRVSFAGALKDVVARVFGWDRTMLEGRSATARDGRRQVDAQWAATLGIPGLTPVSMLQFVGTEVFRQHFHPDIWWRIVEREIMAGQHGKRVVVTDCRFPNEIQMIQRLGGRVWRAQRGPMMDWERKLRDGHPATSIPELAHIHQSEWASIGLEDSIIHNNTTIENYVETVTAKLEPLLR